jgi:L,D-transpeptidase catalytic domain
MTNLIGIKIKIKVTHVAYKEHSPKLFNKKENNIINIAVMLPLRMKLPVVLLLFFTSAFCANAQNVSWYNTDSLLTELCKNEKIHQILNDAEIIYHYVELDTANISLTAFKVAYLEKQLIDKRRIHIRHRRWYKNRKIMSVVDYTKGGNRMRYAVIDLKQNKILHDTLVSHGSGKGERRNDKYHVPVFFSNVVNSEVSSLGMLVTRKARQPENKCHLCKFYRTQSHKCTIIMDGMEKGINDHVKKRDIVMHTTGSANLKGKYEQEDLEGYERDSIVAKDCKCYRIAADGKVKGVAAYASECGLEENQGYIGQSNGCLVLPEDHHVEIMETIKKKSLIFIYSNAVTEGYDYFRESPIMRKIMRYARR